MPGGYSDLYNNTKGAKEHANNVALISEAIREFGHYLIEACDASGECCIHADSIPDLVAEFIDNL